MVFVYSACTELGRFHKEKSFCHQKLGALNFFKLCEMYIQFTAYSQRNGLCIIQQSTIIKS
jgi:hypothetical protein